MFNGHRDKSTCTAGTERGGGESSEWFGKGGGHDQGRERKARGRRKEEEEGGVPFKAISGGAHVVRFPCKKKKEEKKSIPTAASNSASLLLLPSPPSPPPPPPNTPLSSGQVPSRPSTLGACLATR